MKRVLVTGATGFIGRRLCPVLAERGYIVRAAVRGTAPASFPAPVEWCQTGEIGPETDWKRALEGVDYIVHLAALAHQIGKNRPASDYERINTDGTAALASAAKNSAAERLVFISSIGAVCTLSDQVVTESTACRPDSEYGRSKRNAELRLQELLAAGRPDWCILRPTLVYGPENPGNMLRLLQLLKTGLPLPFGAVKNRRSFVYVGNLVDAIEKCLAHPGASRRTFNISDGEVFSTAELLRVLGRQSGRATRLVPVPGLFLRLAGRAGDLAGAIRGRSIGIDTYAVDRLLGSLEVDISALRRELGWKPPFSPEAGFADTLKGFRL